MSDRVLAYFFRAQQTIELEGRQPVQLGPTGGRQSANGSVIDFASQLTALQNLKQQVEWRKRAGFLVQFGCGRNFSPEHQMIKGRIFSAESQISLCHPIKLRSKISPASANRQAQGIVQSVKAKKGQFIQQRGLVGDPRIAFRAFADSLSRPVLPVGLRAQSPTLSPPQPQPQQEMIMSDQTDANDRTPEQQDPPAAAPGTEAAPTAQEPAAAPPAPGTAAAATPVDATVDTIRAEAAEVASICAQAAKLGVTLDAADALRRGVKPEALRSQILDSLAARSDASGILASAPAPTNKPSPLVAAARKSADSAQR